MVLGKTRLGGFFWPVKNLNANRVGAGSLAKVECEPACLLDVPTSSSKPTPTGDFGRQWSNAYTHSRVCRLFKSHRSR